MAQHPYTRLFVKDTAPTGDDDSDHGYEVGDVVHSGGSIYDCTDNTEGAAVWAERATGSMSTANLLEYKGILSCATNPNYPAGVVGDLWLVSSSGKVGGALGRNVETEDAIICRVDNAGGTEASVGSNWFILNRVIAGVLIASNNLNDLTDITAAKANLAISGADVGNSPSGDISSINVQEAINELDTEKAPTSKGVTNGDSHDHSGGDGAQIDFTGLANLPAAVSNSNDIFRCDSCGASGWTGTINGAPSGATVNYTHVSGNKNTLVPQSTSQLGKQRLYNTTRGNHALISNSNGTSNITLTANAPADWQSGDTITTASQTVSGGGFGWVDLEITSGELLGKSAVNLYLVQYDSGAAGNILRTHPFETYGDSKLVLEVAAPSTSFGGTMQGLYKLNSNVISAAWSASGASTGLVIIREAGYIR